VPTFCCPSIHRSHRRDDDANGPRRSNVDRRRTVAARNARRADANADANPRVRRSNGTLDDDEAFERSRWTVARFTYNDGFHAMND